VCHNIMVLSYFLHRECRETELPRAIHAIHP
jgi:hypothetical protein